MISTQLCSNMIPLSSNHYYFISSYLTSYLYNMFGDQIKDFHCHRHFIKLLHAVDRTRSRYDWSSRVASLATLSQSKVRGRPRRKVLYQEILSSRTESRLQCVPSLI